MSDRDRPVAAFLLIFALAAGATLTPAAENQPTMNPEWRLNGDYLRKTSSDLVTAWTAPVWWDGNDFLKFAAFAGATGLLFAFDREIYDWIQDHKTTASIDASRVISKFGNGGYLIGFLAVLYGGGEIFDSRPLRKTALVGFESFVAASAVITVMKIVVGRARPPGRRPPPPPRRSPSNRIRSGSTPWLTPRLGWPPSTGSMTGNIGRRMSLPVRRSDISRPGRSTP
jgi:hypothetical protein